MDLFSSLGVKEVSKLRIPRNQSDYHRGGGSFICYHNFGRQDLLSLVERATPLREEPRRMKEANTSSQCTSSLLWNASKYLTTGSQNKKYACAFIFCFIGIKDVQPLTYR